MKSTSAKKCGLKDCYVPKPVGSDDDGFTDEQPCKESILKGEGESVPALDTLNSYGE
jgi:hypothetical protein